MNWQLPLSTHYGVEGKNMSHQLTSSEFASKRNPQVGIAAGLMDPREMRARTVAMAAKNAKIEDRLRDRAREEPWPIAAR